MNTAIRSVTLACLTSIALPLQARDIHKTDHGFVDLKHGSFELITGTGERKQVKRETEYAEYFPVRVRPGESVRTGEDTDCRLVLPGAGTVRIEAESTVRMPPETAEKKPETSSLELLEGELFLSIDDEALEEREKQFRLKTPTAILAVKGTRFFARARTEVEQFGVHDGKIAVAELASGELVEIATGSEVLAKPGDLSRPRRLSPEDAELAEVYDRFDVRFILGERKNRRFTTSYGAQEDPNSAVYTKYPELIDSTESKESENSAVKMTFQPFAGAKDISVKAEMSIEIPVRLKSAPKLVYFLARPDGVRGFQISGVLEADDTSYTPVLPDSNVIQFPEDAKPGEWVPFLVPLEETESRREGGTLTISVDPNLTEDRAVERVVSVEKDKEEYHLEISPFMIGVVPES